MVKISLPKGNPRQHWEEKLSVDEDPAGFLSKTELRILNCLGEGLASTEIAQSLSLTVGTVRNYISSIMRKTGQHGRARMVRYAFEHALSV